MMQKLDDQGWVVLQEKVELSEQRRLKITLTKLVRQVSDLSMEMESLGNDLAIVKMKLNEI